MDRRRELPNRIAAGSGEQRWSQPRDTRVSPACEGGDHGSRALQGAAPHGWLARSPGSKRGSAAHSLWCAFAIALSSIVFHAGCGGDPEPLARATRADTPPGDTGAAPAAKAEPELSDAQALAWLHEQCGTCHGPKPTGAREMTWPMPVALTREWLEVTESTTAVYEALRRKQLATDGVFPPPMPKAALDADGTKKLTAVVRWFEKSLPFTVADADARYGRMPRAVPPIDFKCKEGATLRSFLARITNAALERPPTPEELDAFATKDLDSLVTHEQRAVLVARLSGEWKQEFRSTGLYKLAWGIGTAGRIVTPSSAGNSAPRDALAAGVADDLENELYALVLANYDAWDYSQYFRANTVMTTVRTAPLYGCAGGAGWQPCPLLLPRTGFFTTLGFLNTRPQTFLSLQNNTGRVQAMYVTLVGEGLPRTGAIGAAAPKLAGCMDASDDRVMSDGAGGMHGAGTASAMATGALCQGCHIGRGVAAGSVLFRPFSTTGMIYDPLTIGTAGAPDQAAFVAATGATWARPAQPTGLLMPVDGAFLKTLLAAPAKACAPKGDPSGPLEAVTDVSQLASTFMADQHAFARGFARHAQRAFGATPLMTLEMANRAIATVEAGRSKFAHLVEAYFMAESFACATAQ